MAFKLDNVKDRNKTVKEKKEGPSLLQKEITLFGNSFSSKIKEDFYTELSVLLKAGISLKVGLELLHDTQKKSSNKAIVASILKAIIDGNSFSDAIKSQKPFSEYEYYSIKIGEETGTLATVAFQLSSFYARKNEQRRTLIAALTYPAIILSTAILVVVFMLQFVVPMFQNIFKQQNIELPAITQFIINLSNFITNYGWAMILLILSLISISIVLNKKKWFQKFKDQLILKTPFIGKFMKIVYLSQFTQAVSLLTVSKVPMVTSIQMVKEMIHFQPLQEALEKVGDAILKGNSLSSSLKNEIFFDNKMVALVKVAEETNQNEYIFERLNEQYNTQVQQQSKILSTIMEPFIILFVGILVGIILIAMYLPMFKLSSVLG